MKKKLFATILVHHKSYPFSGLTSTFRKCEKGITRTKVTMLTVHNIVFNYVKFLLTKFVHFLKAYDITLFI